MSSFTSPVACRIIEGDSLSELRKMPDASVQMCVTSPPYWGLRDYGLPGQYGQEESPCLYISKLVELFSEVKRTLTGNGTLWLNIGDSYATGNTSIASNEHPSRRQKGTLRCKGMRPPRHLGGLKPKDLVGTPWLLAFALRADGWFLRSDIIWAKKNCMPESVVDRPTRAHEYLFLLSKSPKYYYDNNAIKEPCIYDVDGTGTASRKARATADLKSHPSNERAGIRAGGLKDAASFFGKNGKPDKQRGHSRRHSGFNDRWDQMTKVEQTTGMRNKRDVWTVSPAQYREAHFATFPPDLIKPCILAGCPPGGVVLDPFGGSGTTGLVATELGRSSILIELNPEYAAMARRRVDVTPGFVFATPAADGVSTEHEQASLLDYAIGGGGDIGR